MTCAWGPRTAFPFPRLIPKRETATDGGISPSDGTRAVYMLCPLRAGFQIPESLFLPEGSSQKNLYKPKPAFSVNLYEHIFHIEN